MENNKTAWIIAIVLLALLLFAPWNMMFGGRGWGLCGMMGGYTGSYTGGYGWGMMSGGAFGFGWIFMLLFIIAIALLIAWLIQQLQKGGKR